MIQDNLKLPEYLRSTDFKTFEGLMKVLFGSIKKDIDYIPELKDYENCPEHMLPILAQSIGCPYFNATTPYVNRLIIKNWWWMMKNRGTLPAIEMATSLAMLAYNKVLNSNQINIYGRTIELYFDETEGIIYIRGFYQTSETDSTISQEQWIKDIVKYVLPAGFKFVSLPSEFMKVFLEAQTEHIVRIIKLQYDSLLQSGVGLTVLSDTTKTFQDIYTIISGGISGIPTILDINGVPQCPNGLVFGEYNPEDKYYDMTDPSNPVQTNNKCSDCPYATACEAFTTLGIGQQELNQLGYTPNTSNNIMV